MLYFFEFNKFVSGLVCVAMVSVLLSTISDLRFYSADFMKDHEIRVAKRIDDLDFKGARTMASSAKSGFQSLGKERERFLALNAAEINGTWLIYKRTGMDGKVLPLEISAQFQLVENQDGSAAVELKLLLPRSSQADQLPSRLGILLMSKDRPQGGPLLYLVEEVRDLKKGTLEVETSSPVVYEAKRVSAAVPAVVPSKSPESEAVLAKEDSSMAKNNINIPNNRDFFLISVLPRGVNRPLLKGDSISGGLKIQNGTIESMTISFTEKDKDEVNLEIRNSEITNNYFQYFVDGGRQPVSGVINRSSEGEYTVTLVNGPLTGTKLKFGPEKLLRESELAAERDDERREEAEVQEAPAEQVEMEKLPVQPFKVGVKEQEIQNAMLNKRYEQAELAAEEGPYAEQSMESVPMAPTSASETEGGGGGGDGEHGFRF